MFKAINDLLSSRHPPRTETIDGHEVLVVWCPLPNAMYLSIPDMGEGIVMTSALWDMGPGVVRAALYHELGHRSHAEDIIEEKMAVVAMLSEVGQLSVLDAVRLIRDAWTRWSKVSTRSLTKEIEADANAVRHGYKRNMRRFLASDKVRRFMSKKGRKELDDRLAAL